jgi:hypothetical protein
MAIVNGYCTLAEYKAFAAPEAGAHAADDTVINDLITTASRIIDQETKRTFYARTATRLYDVPIQSGRVSRRLWLDDDLLTATTVTNGNGTVLTVADYYLDPVNETPKYAITIKRSSILYWTYDSDFNSEGVISVAGTWGNNATGSHPADIKTATLLVAASMYKRRFGENLSEKSIVTPAGVIVTPQDIPDMAWHIIKKYRRVV